MSIAVSDRKSWAFYLRTNMPKNNSNWVGNKQPEIVYTCKTTTSTYTKMKPKVTILCVRVCVSIKHVAECIYGRIDYHESEIYFNRLYKRMTAFLICHYTTSTSIVSKILSIFSKSFDSLTDVIQDIGAFLWRVVVVVAIVIVNKFLECRLEPR